MLEYKLMKQLLLDYNINELTDLVLSLGEPKFRAKQLFAWIMQGVDFEGMTNLPKVFLEKLKAGYLAQGVKIERVLTSKDKSEKYLFKMQDGELVEGVYLPNSYGNTLCISTQIGCRMGCVFCASGSGGLIRNLSAGEILGQYIAVVSKKATSISNIVLMGSGEPLDNYDNVIKFLRLITDKDGINKSSRNISLSTCGLVPKIKELAEEGMGITLSLSLHATTDEARQKLMPIAKKYSIAETMSAMRYYFEKTGRRVVFEYIPIENMNASQHDAKRLAELTKGLSCHINLIALNAIDKNDKESQKKLQPLSKKEADNFLRELTTLGISASLRRSYGSDIAGACGQLRSTFVLNSKK